MSGDGDGDAGACGEALADQTTDLSILCGARWAARISGSSVGAWQAWSRQRYARGVPSSAGFIATR